jgi:hypothetical protein
MGREAVEWEESPSLASLVVDSDTALRVVDGSIVGA